MEVLLAGGGGFIGGHLSEALLRAGHSVRAVDLKPTDQWWQCHDEVQNVVADLRDPVVCGEVVEGCDRVYNLACDMGGMGFIEANKAACMLSVLINTHLLVAARDHEVERYFFASSACVYPAARQDEPEPRPLREDDVMPADPEDGYGWEKLFSERMCRHMAEDFGLATRVARYHNVFGPHGSWEGGREKAPAALCRKVAIAAQSADSRIEIWGDGEQTRSFLYVDDCVDGTLRLMDSDIDEPVNIGSEESVTINDLVHVVADVAGVDAVHDHLLDAPLGVRGRSSDSTLARQRLGWEPRHSLREGIVPTYAWVRGQVLQAGRTK